MTDRRHRDLSAAVAVGAAILLGLALRCHRITLPIMAFHSWRQTDTAAIARNIYRHGLDPFHPRVDWNGDGPDLVESEFPLMPWTCAVLYHVTGVSETVGRVVSTLSYLATLPFLALLARRLGGPGAVPWAVLLLSVSPLHVIMSRNFQPDAMMLFFSVAAVACWSEYLPSGRSGWAVGAWVTLALALLVKLPAIHLGFPFLTLLLWHRGARGLRSLDAWAVALGSLVPAGAWYAWAHRFPVSFGIWHLGPQNVSNWTAWATAAYARAFWHFFASLGVTPPVFFLAAAGLVCLLVRVRDERLPLMGGWVLGCALLFALASDQTTRHSYYVLPGVPPAVLLAAWVLAAAGRHVGSQPRAVRLGALVLLGALGTWSASVLYRNLVDDIYCIKDLPRRMLLLARLTRARTTSGTLVITAVGHAMPEVLYYSDRRGWHLPYTELTAGRLRKFRDAGVTTLALLQPTLPNFPVSNQDTRPQAELIDWLNEEAFDANFIQGLGYGFAAVLDTRPWLTSASSDDQNLVRTLFLSISETVQSGTGLEALEANLPDVDAFVLPWPRDAERPYRLSRTLIGSPRWRLVRITDQGFVFLRASGEQATRAEALAYRFLDPTNDPAGFSRVASPDDGILRACETEALRAVTEDPGSIRCAIILGWFYARSGRSQEGLRLFQTPALTARYPRESLLRQLTFAIQGRDDGLARSLADEIRRRWPDETRLEAILRTLQAP